jgi:glutamine amidotransferase
MISIIDYGLGNVGAFKSAYDQLEINSQIIKNSKNLEGSSHIIIPGVGSFDNAMNQLEEYGFKNILNEIVTAGESKILGICVGLQIMCKSSSEGTRSGFGWIDAEVKKIKLENQKIILPHMGWNSTRVIKKCPLLKDINHMEEFYYLHSYNLYDTNDFGLATSKVFYETDLISSISYKNIFGTQFHPEKSHDQGLKILKNFSEI